MRSCESCSWLKIYPNPKKIYSEFDFLTYCEQFHITKIDINQRLSKGEKLEAIACSHWTDDWVK